MEDLKKTQDFQDDGRTIAQMNVEGMPWYKPYKKNTASSEALHLTRAEKSAMFRGIMSELVPLVVTISFVFTMVLLILDVFWLSK